MRAQTNPKHGNVATWVLLGLSDLLQSQVRMSAIGPADRDLTVSLLHVFKYEAKTRRPLRFT